MNKKKRYSYLRDCRVVGCTSEVMMKNHRHDVLAHFQSRTAICNTDECMKILEQFQWNFLEAVTYILENVESTRLKSSKLVHQVIQPSVRIDQPLLPNECLVELEGVRHFERVFQDRHANVQRWPVWFKSSLENVVNQSHGPFAIFLNHDASTFATMFSRQILCSASILNVFTKYKCILWPWDITHPLNKQRLLERSGRVRQVLLDCLSRFDNIDSYPLLLLLSHRKDRIVLLDVVSGDYDLDQTRACLERTFNPVSEQCMLSTDETTSLSSGWIGGRTAGHIRRRPSFIIAFSLSRSIRVVQRPHYISFYQPKEDTPEIIVSKQEVKQWLDRKNTNTFTSNSTSLTHHSSKTDMSPVPSLSVSFKDQHSIVYMSPRRAGWAPLIHR